MGGELWRGDGSREAAGGGGVICEVVSRYCGREGSGRDGNCFWDWAGWVVRGREGGEAFWELGSGG